MSGAASDGAHALEYDVRLEPKAAQLEVEACPGVAGVVEWIGGRGAEVFLLQVARNDDPEIERRAARLHTSDWNANDCLRYTVDLAAAANERRSMHDRTRLGSDIWLLSPDAWLWRPAASQSAVLTIHSPKGWSASLPWQRETGQAHRYRLPPRPVGWQSLSAFGRFATRSLALPGGRIELAVLAPREGALAAKLLAWQSESANLMLELFGRTPLPSVQVLSVPVSGAREPVPWAQSSRGGGVALHFYVDLDASARTLRSDWTAAHEYTHLFHPYLGAEGQWLAEGLASYYQNILRMRAGTMTEAQGWRALHGGFGRGRRASDSDDGTLDRAARRMRDERNFMRVYWSGAAFWLEADIALRQSSDNRLSVDEALVRFADCCLPQTRAWTAAQFVERLDRSLGTTILASLYRTYRSRKGFPDLGAAYSALGLDPASAAIRKDADPAARGLRRAIATSRASASQGSVPGD